MAAINNRFAKIYLQDCIRLFCLVTLKSQQASLLGRLIDRLCGLELSQYSILITNFANTAVLSEDCHTQFWRNCYSTHKWQVDRTLLAAFSVPGNTRLGYGESIIGILQPMGIRLLINDMIFVCTKCLRLRLLHHPFALQ